MIDILEAMDDIVMISDDLRAAVRRLELGMSEDKHLGRGYAVGIHVSIRHTIRIIDSMTDGLARVRPMVERKVVIRRLGGKL